MSFAVRGVIAPGDLDARLSSGRVAAVNLRTGASCAPGSAAPRSRMINLVDAAEAWLRRAAGEPIPEDLKYLQVEGHTQVESAVASGGRASASATAPASAPTAAGASEGGDAGPSSAAPDACRAPAHAESGAGAVPDAAPGAAPDAAPGAALGAAPAAALANAPVAPPLDMSEVKSASFWEPVYAKPRRTPRGTASSQPGTARDGSPPGASSPPKSPGKRRTLAGVGRAVLLVSGKKRPASARAAPLARGEGILDGEPLEAPPPRPSTARESRSPLKRGPGAVPPRPSPSPASRSPPPGLRRGQQPPPSAAQTSPSKFAAGGGAGGVGGAGGAGGAGFSASSAQHTETPSGSGQSNAAAQVRSIFTSMNTGGRPYFGDRPSAPFRDAFRRKPRPKDTPGDSKPSPSTFIHPCVTPLSTVQSAPVVTGEIDVKYYAEPSNHADISMVPVAEVMRQRAQAIGLIDSPQEEWDAPVRVMTESLGQVLGMDWPKYAAAMSSSEPTAEHRLRLKINRLDALVASETEEGGGAGGGAGAGGGEEGAGGGASSQRAAAPGSSRSAAQPPASQRGVSGEPTKQGPAASARLPPSPRGGEGGAGSSRRGGGGSARSGKGGGGSARAKKTYTRDGKLIDTSMRSAQEAALIERVQGHSTLAPPTTQHPSIAKYVDEDGSSLIKDGQTAIKPQSLAINRGGGGAMGSALLPKWQVEKQIEEEKQRDFRRTHIDYSLLAPKNPSWAPEWQRVRGAERVEGGAASLMHPGSTTGGAPPRAASSARGGSSTSRGRAPGGGGVLGGMGATAMRGSVSARAASPSSSRNRLSSGRS